MIGLRPSEADGRPPIVTLPLDHWMASFTPCHCHWASDIAKKPVESFQVRGSLMGEYRGLGCTTINSSPPFINPKRLKLTTRLLSWNKLDANPTTATTMAQSCTGTYSYSYYDLVALNNLDDLAARIDDCICKAV